MLEQGGSNAKREQSDIHQALDLLSIQHMRLEQAISRLNERIGPILRPSGPTSSEVNKGGTTGNSSELVAILRNAGEFAKLQADRLEDLFARATT